ncbi:MAG: hypothetical protein ACKV19_23615 [Verrucomicrobiales bacterium]
MSDDTQPQPPPSPVPPPSPLGKTQPVPLKKETVRITLRAKPGEGTEGAAPAPPTAPLRPAAPPPAVARPAAPPPPAGAVGSRTIPLSPAPAPAAPRSPTAPAASPAPTRPMTTPLAPAQAAASGPRPTVRLQPQQGPGVGTGTISSAPLKPAAAEEEEAEDDESGLGLLAGITTGIAALFLIVAALSSDSLALGVSLDQRNPGWKIPRPSPLNSEGKAKEDYAKKDILAGTWSSDMELAGIPEYKAPK